MLESNAINNVLNIVITGRIGTGKTTYAANRSAKIKEHGAKVLNLDYDRLAHTVLFETYGIKTESERRELARKVFESDALRAELEQKLHPKIYELANLHVLKFLNSVDDVVKNSKIYILHQIPLYERTKQMFYQYFGDANEVVTLTATTQEIIERLTVSRNMSKDEVCARLQAS